jgi:uncharacterized protein (DUF1501 family)
MRRRDLLGLAAGLPLVAALPAPLRAAGTGPGERLLVLVELNGGNDGLNTVVPYDDPAYARARPRLAVARDRVLKLDERLGLAPELEPLMAAWRSRELAIALGVGYPRPNRSHFRSIEIWNSASDSEAVLQDGWVARVFAESGFGRCARRDDLAADGLVLGGPSGPLAGAAMRTVVMRNPERFLKGTSGTAPGQAVSGNPALDHILTVRGQIYQAARRIEARLDGTPGSPVDFPKTRLGRQLAVAARLVAAGVPVAAIKVAQGGFDTHAGQAGQHRTNLGELAEALAAFRTALVRAGAWDRVLVMTYAELGRRVAENGSGGTDHGTAAPHLLLGGRVRGGLYGSQPSLGDLEAGDLKHGLDFRSLYATAAHGWWGLAPTTDSLGRHSALPCLA